MTITVFKSPLRPARPNEIGYVQKLLNKAIDELFDADSDFARAEKSRFHRNFLLNLINADPGHVVIVETLKGQNVGFIVGVPDMGNMILSWGYIEPEFRKGTLAMRAFGEFVRQWDNRQFHKMIYYALPNNKQSEAIGRHAKFEIVGLLKKHFFGVDFVMYQKFYNKSQAGSAAPLRMLGYRGRLRLRLAHFLPSKKT